MADDLTISVRVIPRASKSEVVGMVDGNLKVRIAAPPADGAANAELIRLLSKYFDLPKRNIEIVSGSTSRLKRLRVGGLETSRIDEFLKGRL